MEMTRSEAIKKFFNTDGYPPVENSEMVKFAKNDKKDFQEVGDLALEALGATLKPVK